MNRTLIVNIPMAKKTEKLVYTSDNKSLIPSRHPFVYAVLSYLEPILQDGDTLKCILIAKTHEYSTHEENIQEFKNEMNEINRYSIPVEYVVIYSEFEETVNVHESLMREIINNVEDGATVLADITYGSKDLPLIEFAALTFASDFLDCHIERIIYGQGFFINNELQNKKLCDMMDLFTMCGLVSSFKNVSPSKARELLDMIINFSNN